MRNERDLRTRRVGCLALAAWLAFGLVSPLLAADGAASDPKPEAMKQRRKKAAQRRRRIIVDNDGNEVVYTLEKATTEALLAARTTGLVGTQVDTIVYCTWSSGFSFFTHNTKVGQVFDCTEKGFSKNKTRDFIEQGADALEIVVDFCRQKGIEIFWSMRMNDTHDAWGGWYSPLLFPKLKKDHPEFLVSSMDRKSKCGGWTAVDYGRKEIRDLAFRFIEEVCQNYDVDGVMLDFFRHPVYFKRHAMGGVVGTEELDQMTSMIRRVRAMADKVGLERGRPILIAVRTPDSVDYCRAVGLDVVRWMAEDLIDLLVVSGYFRLNPWETSVKLGHKYGVPVYPCLSETRLRDKEASKVRRSLDCYRARAMNVWHSGADGVFMFNYTNPRSPLWRQIGDPKTIATADRVYCTGARGGKVINRWLVGGQRFWNRSPLSPERPRKLDPGKSVTVELRVGEDVSKGAAGGGTPDLKLALRVAGLVKAEALAVKLNGRPLDRGAMSAKQPSAAPKAKPSAKAPVPDAWVEYPLAPSSVRVGVSQFEVALDRQCKTGIVLKDLLLWVRCGNTR